ncbi:MAG: CDP-glycerol glycerophosphotransferase family protein [Elusimicrobia bacterium]|nr:CDP-glycerol glycerophosphotransferase family protein [Elusimicrobiota bacterium]
MTPQIDLEPPQSDSAYSQKTILLTGSSGVASHLQGKGFPIVAGTQEARWILSKNKIPHKPLLSNHQIWAPSLYHDAVELTFRFLDATKQERQNPIWNQDGACLWEALASEMCLYYFSKAIQTAEALGYLSENEIFIDDLEHPLSQVLQSGAPTHHFRVRSLELTPKRLSAREKPMESAREFARNIKAAMHPWSQGWHRQNHTKNLPPKTDILFLNFVPRQTENIATVIRKASQAGLSSALLLGHRKPLPTTVGKISIPTLTLDDFVSHQWVPSRKQFGQAWEQFQKSAQIREILQWKGFDLFPLLEHPLKDLVRWRMPQLRRQIQSAGHVLKLYKPSIIVTTDVNHSLVRGICSMGKSLGIPSFNVQHGLPSKEGVEWCFMVQDRTTSPGSFATSILKYHGVSLDKTIETGAPCYDGWSENLALRSETRKKLSIGEKENLLVYMSIPPSLEMGGMEGMLSSSEAERNLSAISQISSKVENLRVIVKAHPEEDVERLLHFAKEHPSLKIMDQMTSYEMLQASDAVITWHSTTGLEAMILGKPLIVLNMTPKPDPVPYVQEAGAISARSEKELFQAVDDLFSYPQAIFNQRQKQNRLLKEWIICPGEEASQRVLQSIVAMLPT